MSEYMNLEIQGDLKISQAYRDYDDIDFIYVSVDCSEFYISFTTSCDEVHGVPAIGIYDAYSTEDSIIYFMDKKDWRLVSVDRVNQDQLYVTLLRYDQDKSC